MFVFYVTHKPPVHKVFARAICLLLLWICAPALFAQGVQLAPKLRQLESAIHAFERENSENLLDSCRLLLRQGAVSDSLKGAFYNLKGIFHYNFNEYREANAAFREAILYRTRATGARGRALANSFYNRGNTLMELDRYEEAAQAYEGAAALYENAGDRLNQNEALSAYASCRIELGQYGQAQKLLRSLEKKLPDSELGQRGSIFRALSNSFFYQGRLDSAQWWLEQALRTYQRDPEGNGAEISFCKYDLALILQDQGKEKRALQLLQEDLEYIRSQEVVNPGYLASNYAGQASLYFQRGDLAQAVAYFERAIALDIPAAEEYRLGLYHHNLGLAYWEMNRQAEAQRAFEKARNILIEHFGPQSAKLSTVYASMGSLATERGDFESAERLLKQALDLALAQKEQDRSMTDIFEHYTDWAELFIQKKEPDLAQKALFQALNLSQKLGEQGLPRQYLAHILLAETALLKGEEESALTHLDRGIDLLCQGSEPEDLIAVRDHARIVSEFDLMEALEKKADLLAKKAEYENSYVQFRLAMDLEYQVQGLLRESASLKSLKAATRQLYSHAMDLCWQAHSQNPQEPWIARAFEVAERSKAAWLRQLLHETQVKSFTGIPKKILDQETELKSELLTYRKRLHEVGDRDSEEARMLREQLLDLSESYETFTAKMEREYPAYFHLKFQRPGSSLQNLQQHLREKAPETLVLEYFCGEEHCYLMAVSAGHIQFKMLGEADSLHAAIEQVFEQLVRPDWAAPDLLPAFQRPSHALFQILLQGVLDDPAFAGIKALRILPGEGMARLPFEVLLAKPDGETFADLPYLGKGFRISYDFSADLLMDRPRQGSVARLPFLGMAPGDFAQLAPLHYTRIEVEGLQKLVGGEAFFGERASESRFKDQAGKAKILHLATHALLAGDSLHDACIVLQAGDREDGRLYASELYNLSLNAELAVLSACNTGAGEHFPGEGSMSLARSFYYSGCATVIMSQWSNNDEATARLMRSFYQYLLEGKSKAEALQAAKTEFLAQADYESAHPYYWAGFTLLGAEGSLSIERPQSRLKWIWISGISLLLISGWLVFRTVRRRSRRT